MALFRPILRLLPILLLGLTVSGCYQYDLKVIKENARLRARASHNGRIVAHIEKGKVLLKLKKINHWYQVEYSYLNKKGKTRKLKGYIYKDDVWRVHHARNIYSRNYKEDDNLALMISLPFFFALISVWLAASKTRWLNVLLGCTLVFMILTQSVYILAVDRGKRQRGNGAFRAMTSYIKKINKKRKIFIWFTDVTWAARIEVLTDFGMHFDRFSRDRKYNSKARMRSIKESTDLTKVKGYVLTDPFYYPYHVSWPMPERFYNLDYPANWRLVKKVGSARLYYAK